MAAPDLVASQVMDKSASLLNDTGKQIYTYVAQLPYLNMAFQELQEEFELYKIPVTQQVSAIINVPGATSPGVTTLTYGYANFPIDMIEPQQLWERQAGIDPFIPMTRREYLPHDLEGVLTNQFIYYAWMNQSILVINANQSNDIKIDYVKYLFTTLVDQNSSIGIINAATFLEFRTAALCAEFIERNLSSSNSLNQMALLAMGRVLGIGVQGKQVINTRRRPFRAAYKKRGWMT